MWALFALGAALLSSFNPILYKRMLENSSPLRVVWAVTLLGLPLLGLLTFLQRPELPEFDQVFLLAVLGSAGMNVAAHLASTQALKLEDVSVVTPLLIFSPVFTAIIAVAFLDETLSARGLFGITLVLTGAYWLNRSSRTAWLAPLKAFSLKPGVLLVLLAGLLWAVTPILEKTAILHTKPQNPLFAALAVNGVLVLILTGLVFHREHPLRSLQAHKRELVLAGMIAGTAPILGYTAFSLGPVGYVTTLFKFSTLLSVPWSALFLKERGLSQRAPATLLMVIGAILIALS
jgi:drug/metabolite transporter (DMT)-like permease